MDKSSWKKLKRELVKQGCEVIPTKKHHKIYRDGQLISVMPSSPGGGRGYANQISHLRRQGVNV